MLQPTHVPTLLSPYPPSLPPSSYPCTLPLSHSCIIQPPILSSSPIPHPTTVTTAPLRPFTPPLHPVHFYLLIPLAVSVYTAKLAPRL